MGVGAFFLSSGSGLMLLFMGVLLDAPTLSPSKRWEIFFILVACLAGIAVVLAAISMYNDTRNPLRPLRLRHTPTPSFDKALSNNKSQADDESTPLLANGNAQIGKRLSFTAVPLMWNYRSQAQTFCSLSNETFAIITTSQCLRFFISKSWRFLIYQGATYFLEKMLIHFVTELTEVNRSIDPAMDSVTIPLLFLRQPETCLFTFPGFRARTWKSGQKTSCAIQSY